MVEDNPLDLGNIKERQDEDNDLSQSLMRHPTSYSRKNIKDVNDILCYTKPGNNAANWKIALPRDLIRPTIMWYHQVTGLGAALIKNYSSYVQNKKSPKKVPHVFSPKLVLGDQKPLLDRWQTLLPSLPILSNKFSSKLTPLGLNA
jgi:hypothetical protein